MITREESKIITINRVLAMQLIVLCHYIGWFPRVSFLGQFFNVGIPMFFIISGYLYGQKRIERVVPWLWRRFIILSTPLYVYYVTGALLLFVIGRLGDVNCGGTIKLFLHLQGLFGGGIGQLQTGHLWFVTFIFICYLITPLMQKGKLGGGMFAAAIIIISTLEITAMLVFGTWRMLSWTPGVFCYMIGYHVAGHWSKNVGKKTICFLTVLMIISVGLRLGAKAAIDGTRLYDLVIVPYTHCLIAFWIFFTVFWICQNSTRILDKLFQVCNVVAPYSFEVYIVHYCLIKGVASLQNLTGCMIINTLVLLFGVVILAVILKKASTPLIKYVAFAG